MSAAGSNPAPPAAHPFVEATYRARRGRGPDESVSPTKGAGVPVDIASGRVGVTWDPEDGARITSLRLDGHEVLAEVDMPHTPTFWTHGLFAMAPYAGR